MHFFANFVNSEKTKLKICTEHTRAGSSALRTKGSRLPWPDVFCFLQCSALRALKNEKRLTQRSHAIQNKYLIARLLIRFRSLLTA